MSGVRPSPFVFVVGCPRSGTTLLQRMLDAHGQLAVANDSNFIHKALKSALPDWRRYVKRALDPPLVPALVEFVRTYKRFVRLSLPDADVSAAAAATTTYAGFVRNLYTAWGRRQGKPLAGEKTPDYVRRLPFLHGLFPTTPFVHIVRDPREVALSLREWAVDGRGPAKFELWQQEPMATAAMWWCWMVATGRRDGRQLGADLYLEVRYERLVQEPEATLREITAFLGLDFDPAMLRFHEGKSGYQPHTSAKSAWLPPTPGLRDWRAQLSPRDLQLIESLAGELMDELGYARGGGTITADNAAAAAHCRRWWHSSSKDADGG